MKTIKVRIPLIVTADCRWAASGSHSANGEPDWVWLDEMCDDTNPTIAPRKMWVEAEVPVPDDSEQIVAATAVESAQP